MVEVRVAGVALDELGQHVILLKPVEDLPGVGSVLPVWIGSLEATSIMIALEGAVVPRPLTHDLIRALVTASGAQVQRVEVTRIEDGTFYAAITLSTMAGIRVVDARPSDAVALASRTDAPIFVSDVVMSEAGVPDMHVEEDEELSVDEFKRFLNDVDPDDFRG